MIIRMCKRPQHRFGSFSGYLFVTSNGLSYLVIANYYITSANYAALDNETFSNSDRILIKTKCILINFWRHLMSNNTSFKNKSLCIKIAIVATVSWNGEWVN